MMYRYYALDGNLKFFESKFALPAFFVAGVVYPFPTLTFYSLALSRITDDLVKNIFETTMPELLPLLNLASCSSFPTDGSANAYFLSAIIQTLLVPVITFTYAFKIVKLLKAVRSSLSASTYAAQKQLFIALCLQIAIPTLCFIIPIVVFLCCYLAGKTLSGFSQLAVEMVALHGTMNGIMIVITIKPYREEFMRMIFWKKKDNMGSQRIQPTLTSLDLK
uniref:Serpentine Receptor, class H n=1 Tax=Panagrolaimus sp. JU765 TaxID=591449 RepID=A0AC34R973_9BILA